LKKITENKIISCSAVKSIKIWNVENAAECLNKVIVNKVISIKQTIKTELFLEIKFIFLITLLT